MLDLMDLAFERCSGKGARKLGLDRLSLGLIAHAVNPEKFEGPLFHLTSGAMMFGAFFIATDYVGAPITPWGRLIFGIGVGVLVMIIRLFGKYPEGFMFAILIMNALTPLIERWTIPTPFGGHVVTQRK